MVIPEIVQKYQDRPFPADLWARSRLAFSSADSFKGSIAIDFGDDLHHCCFKVLGLQQLVLLPPEPLSSLPGRPCLWGKQRSGANTSVELSTDGRHIFRRESAIYFVNLFRGVKLMAVRTAG